MGQEVACAARLGGARSEGKALLETDELLFRGAFRLRIPLAAIGSLEVSDGELTVSFPGGTAIFELGPRAERFAERIRNPRTLADKLGVEPGMRVSIAGRADAELMELLRQRTEDVRAGRPRSGSDLVFVRVETAGDLPRIAAAAPFLRPGGALWAIAPKGRAELPEAAVLAAGRQAGLVDTKVARFSATHTAHRFSIPRSRR